MKWMEVIPCVAVALVYVTLASAKDTVNVQTPLGTVTGIGVPVVGLSGRKSYQFRRIPYAKSPTDELRFKKPVPYGAWDKTLDGTEFGPQCMQMIDPFSQHLLPNKEMSEDCLFLNVYIPNGLDLTKKKAVMVWIHGGAYETGSGTIYDASYMSVKADVIIVTINYRLGIFGFFTLNDTAALGNFGLWDQILAMKWVHDTCAYFGGDPSNVTIFGESAGGFSVGLHTLIPSNHGLFQRAIAQSGVADTYLAMAGRKGKEASILMGELLGCHYSKIPTELDKFMKCMRSAPAEDIVNLTAKAVSVPELTIHFDLPLAPVIDGELFSETPQNLMSDQTSESYKFFRSLDVVVGNCNSEGSLTLLTMPRFQKIDDFDINKGIPYNVFCDKVVRPLTDDYFNGNRKVSSAICQEYGREDEAEQARQLVDLYTDFFFIVPAVYTLQFHARNATNGNTYQFIFTQRSPLPYGPKRPPWYRGSGHASELAYLFGIRKLPEVNVTVTADDLKLSDEMVAYWTNFAKTGNPNDMSGSLPVWKPFDVDNRHCLDLNYNTTLINHYDEERVKFWMVDIPNIVKRTA